MAMLSSPLPVPNDNMQSLSNRAARNREDRMGHKITSTYHIAVSDNFNL
jgi:hypothetical protein